MLRPRIGWVIIDYCPYAKLLSHLPSVYFRAKSIHPNLPSKFELGFKYSMLQNFSIEGKLTFCFPKLASNFPVV
jgi:hypothetical protein